MNEQNRIFTSYYSKINKFDPERFIRIQISRGCPVRGFIDLKWLALMPSVELLRDSKAGLITNDQYRSEYITQLESITYDTIHHQFDRLLSSGKNLVLFCYESPEGFCHRHILADWYNGMANDKIITEYVHSSIPAEKS